MKRLPFFLLLLFPAISMAETSPRVTQVMRVPLPASEMAAIDADGDGDLDIVSYSTSGEIPTWYENLGNRQFANPRVISYPTGDYEQIPADLDGDGIVDLLISSRGKDSQGRNTVIVSVVILDSDLKPVKRYKLYEGQDKWAVVNLDGNGPAEILQLLPRENGIDNNPTTLKIWNLQQDGTLSSWTSPIDLPYVEDIDHAHAVDIDGDGDLDLHVGRFLLKRDGSQTFCESYYQIDYASSSDYREILTNWADLDGDGLPEPYQQANGRFSFLKNEGSFSFRELDGYEYVDATLLGVQEVSGEPAILTYCDYPDERDEIYGLKRYRFGSATSISNEESLFPNDPPIEWSRPTVMADFDGDGTQDVVMENGIQLGVSLLRPMLSTDSRSIGILWGNGNDFPESSYISSPPLLYISSYSGDYDRDGDQDIITGPNIFGQFELLLNDGRGNFSFGYYLDELLPAELKNQGVIIESLVAGDVDHDGDVDLLVNYEQIQHYNDSPKCISVFALNEGHGHFNAPVLPVGAFDFTYSNSGCDGLYDWDGDGDLDATKKGSWMKNVNGVLTSGTIPLISGASVTNALGYISIFESCKYGDLDGDGRSDIISEIYEATISDEWGWPMIISTNMAIGFSDEFGVLEEVVTLPIQMAGTDALGNPATFGYCQIIDLNLDGLNDLVYTRINGTDELGNPLLVTEWKRNPGHGSRNPATWITLPLPFNASIKGDFDGDGRMDYTNGKAFITPTRSGPECSMKYDFIKNVTFGSLWGPTSSEISDYDGDGDSDSLLKRNGQLSLVRNLIIDERSGVAAKLRTLGVLGKTANPDEDVDGDGRDNATELLQGTDPRVADQPQTDRTKPGVLLAGGQVKVQFQSRTDADELNLSYILESSTNLSEWTTVGLADATSNPLDGAWQQLTVTGEKQDKAFYRVRSEHQVPIVAK